MRQHAHRFVILLRLAIVVAIAASSALLVDYANVGDPAFCGVGSGCMAVRRSPYSHIGPFVIKDVGVIPPISLPMIGVVAFSFLLLASLAPKSKSLNAWFTALVVGGSIFGVALLYVQFFVIHEVCKWCLAADTSAIVAGVAAAIIQKAIENEKDGAVEEAVRDRSSAPAWFVAGFLAVALPILWGEYPIMTPLPADIAALQEAGKVNIVNFTDFECPFCRKLHPAIEEVRKELGDRAHYVRKMMPLDGHPGAMPAALAYTCVPDDKKEAMAAALYGAPEDLLTRAGTIGIAHGLGVDEQMMNACVDEPATRAKVEADIAMFDRIGGAALPLTYVEDRLVMGLNEDRLKKVVAIAGRHRAGLPIAWMFVALAAAFVAASVMTWRSLPAIGATKRARSS